MCGRGHSDTDMPPPFGFGEFDLSVPFGIARALVIAADCVTFRTTDPFDIMQ